MVPASFPGQFPCPVEDDRVCCQFLPSIVGERFRPDMLVLLRLVARACLCHSTDPLPGQLCFLLSLVSSPVDGFES